MLFLNALRNFLEKLKLLAKFSFKIFCTEFQCLAVLYLIECNPWWYLLNAEQTGDWLSFEYCSFVGYFNLSVNFLDLKGRHWCMWCKGKRQFPGFIILFSFIIFVSLKSGSKGVYLFLKLKIWIALCCMFATLFRL